MAKARVFKDAQLQEEFDKNGFVKFKMFSDEQIERLRNYYQQTQQQHETIADKKKFHATNDTDDAALIAGADSAIKSVMLEEIDKHFYNYKTIAASYLIKQPDDASELAPHQDLRFVDEAEYYSFNIWVATEATDKNNGCLRFLKGSHLIADTVRPLPSYPWKYESVLPLIPQYLTDVPTEIGDCVVLNHACIHASYPNRSGHIRIAAILAMIPQEAAIVHYFLPDGNPANKVEKYKMTLTDFVNLKGGKRPENAVLESAFNYDFSPIDKTVFMDWLKAQGYTENSNNRSIADRLKKFLNGAV